MTPVRRAALQAIHDKPAQFHQSIGVSKQMVSRLYSDNLIQAVNENGTRTRSFGVPWRFLLGLTPKGRALLEGEG